MGSDLATALAQFDAVEANLRRLERVWEGMRELIPSAISFSEGGTEARRYAELGRAFDDLVGGLPPIGASMISTRPMGLNEIAQNRLDAQEIGETEAMVSVEEAIDEPRREIDEYRFRLNRARRELVRDHMRARAVEIDALLASLTARLPSDHQPVSCEDWDALQSAVGEVERLAGGQVPRTGRWQELRRHLAFGQGIDLHDIASHDWPSVWMEIEANLYSELEPVPVEVENLELLVLSRPTGRVTTKLRWEAISPEEFERLLYNIVSDASDYSNQQWLMATNAPDRGRDISADRLTTDALSGSKTQHVIIEAKHWLTRPVGAAEVSASLARLPLWDRPAHVLVIATSGRFSADGVALTEKHNNAGNRPIIELWPENHLERLLAERPYLVVGFGLR
jgi:hypothetical protein